MSTCINNEEYEYTSVSGQPKRLKGNRTGRDKLTKHPNNQENGHIPGELEIYLKNKDRKKSKSRKGTREIQKCVITSNGRTSRIGQATFEPSRRTNRGSLR